MVLKQKNKSTWDINVVIRRNKTVEYDEDTYIYISIYIIIWIWICAWIKNFDHCCYYRSQLWIPICPCRMVTTLRT
jgi:hypothetical protein